MPILFHQNMRVFGGGSAPRNTAYNQTLVNGGAFATIRNGLGGGVGPIAVAGFTEITNNGASQAALTTSCTRLMGANGVFVGNVACGKTALTRGNSEYVGLGRLNTYGLLGVGRILFGRGMGGGLALLHQRANTTALLNGLGYPQGMSVDYRGLVYIMVSLPGGGGNNIAVGFIHNMYTMVDQRALVAGKIFDMTNLMRQTYLGNVMQAAYIGGDFNVAPRARGGLNALSANAPGYPAGAAGVGTTYSGSTYDYWYANQGVGAGGAGLLVPPVASADSTTLDSGPGAAAAGLARRMSDHTATLLQII